MRTDRKHKRGWGKRPATSRMTSWRACLSPWLQGSARMRNAPGSQAPGCRSQSAEPSGLRFVVLNLDCAGWNWPSHRGSGYQEQAEGCESHCKKSRDASVGSPGCEPTSDHSPNNIAFERAVLSRDFARQRRWPIRPHTLRAFLRGYRLSGRDDPGVHGASWQGVSRRNDWDRRYPPWSLRPRDRRTASYVRVPFRESDFWSVRSLC